MTKFEELKKYLIGGIAAVVAATGLTACDGDKPVDTSGQANSSKPESSIVESSDSFENSSNSSDNSFEVSDTISETSSEVSDNSDVSDTSDDTNKDDNTNPDDPTAITGEDVMDELLEYLPGIYAKRYHLPYEEAARRLQDVHYKNFGIDIYAGYDPTYDAGVSEFYDGTGLIPCVLWGAKFRDDYYGDQVLNMYIPPEHPTMIAIREKMGVAPNKLSALMWTEEEILDLDSETAQLLLDVINASKNYTAHKTPDNKPAM